MHTVAGLCACVCACALATLSGCTNYKGQRCEENPETSVATGRIKYSLYDGPQRTSNATYQFKEARFHFMISDLRVWRACLGGGGGGVGLSVWIFFSKPYRAKKKKPKKLSRGDGVEGSRWPIERRTSELHIHWASPLRESVFIIHM